MLLVLNLPMIGMWVQLLKLPYNILFPLIILFTIIGVYCSSNNVFDVYVMIDSVSSAISCASSVTSRRRWCGVRAGADAGERICASR